MELCETQTNKYLLRIVPDQEALLDFFDGVICSDTNSLSGEREFRLTTSALYRARDLCFKGNLQGAQNTLISDGFEEEQAQRLTRSLYKPVRNTSVIVIANRNTANTQYVQGFSILEGPDNLWIMEPYEENSEEVIAFIPANAEKIRARFLEILPRRSNA